MSKPQTIKRASHGKDNPYFLMLRNTAQDRDLSYEARGMLAYILSKPDDWEVMLSDLQQEGCGREKTRRVIKELITHGYIKDREPIRKDGKIDSYTPYMVYESPQTGFQETAIQETGFQDSGNHPLHNTDKQNKEKEQSKEKTIPPNGVVFDPKSNAFELKQYIESSPLNMKGSRAFKLAQILNGTYKKNPKEQVDTFVQTPCTVDELAKAIKLFYETNPGAAMMQRIEIIEDYVLRVRNAKVDKSDLDQKLDWEAI